MCISPTKQTAAEVAHQHHNAQCAVRSAAKRQAQRAANPEFDPKLLKPVRLVAPPQGLRPAERARLTSELISLKRERDTTQEAIDYILEQLAA